MNNVGDADLLVAARGALLDALEALRDHHQATIVIGAQAIYLHAGAAPVALAEATKDCDLALDTRLLPPHPLLEEAMRNAGFQPDMAAGQPGHKLGERQATPARLVDKDAHDIYRLLVATPTDQLANTLRRIRHDQFAGSATEQALAYLATMFAAGPEAPGSRMAGRAEEGVGEPALVSAATTALAEDLLAGLAGAGG